MKEFEYIEQMGMYAQNLFFAAKVNCIMNDHIKFPTNSLVFNQIKHKPNLLISKNQTMK